MKLYNFFSIVLVLSRTILSNNTPNLENTYEKVKIKRGESSNECKNIKSLLNKEETYNCCEDSEVKCEKGHITEL